MRVFFVLLILCLVSCGSTRKVSNYDSSEKLHTNNVSSKTSHKDAQTTTKDKSNRLDLSNYKIRVIPSKLDTTSRKAVFSHNNNTTTIDLNPRDTIEIIENLISFQDLDVYKEEKTEQTQRERDSTEIMKQVNEVKEHIVNRKSGMWKYAIGVIIGIALVIGIIRMWKK